MEAAAFTLLKKTAFRRESEGVENGYEGKRRERNCSFRKWRGFIDESSNPGEGTKVFNEERGFL